VADGVGIALGAEISGIDNNGAGVSSVGFVGVVGAVGCTVALNGVIGEAVDCGCSQVILTTDGEKVKRSGSFGFIGAVVDCGSCVTGEGVVTSIMQGASSLSQEAARRRKPARVVAR